MDKLLETPPFPILIWDDFCWRGSLQLKSWAGFQSRRGPYNSVDSPAGSDGTASLTVFTSNDQPVPPTVEQAAAIRFLFEHEEQIRDSILRAVLDAYPEIREDYEDAGEEMPDISVPDELMPHLGLSFVHCLRVSRSDMVYLGFELGCSWEPEHGLGVMTHGTRVIEVGGADTSFLEWIADTDAAEN
ncbi:MAG: DUF6985 domain-containing protein [Armatimonadota bacterium]